MSRRELQRASSWMPERRPELRVGAGISQEAGSPVSSAGLECGVTQLGHPLRKSRDEGRDPDPREGEGWGRRHRGGGDRPKARGVQGKEGERPDLEREGRGRDQARGGVEARDWEGEEVGAETQPAP